jgi:hypothetical protein
MTHSLDVARQIKALKEQRRKELADAVLDALGMVALMAALVMWEMLFGETGR